MYKPLLQSIDQAIEKHSEFPVSKEVTERDKHYFIQGLKMAKLLAAQEEELVRDEFAYESFQELYHYFSEILEPEQIKEILETIEFEELL